MRVTKYLLLFIFTLILTNLQAADEETIAVIEFKNKTKGGLRFKGTDMAAWLSNNLKDEDRYEPADRKAVAKIVKNAKWIDYRLAAEDEAKIQSLPAKYALYSTLVNLQSTFDATSTGTAISPTNPQRKVVPAVNVMFHFELVDLSTGKPVKSFETQGSGMSNNIGAGPVERSAQEDIADFDNTFEEACKTAIRKAANELSEQE